MNTRRSAEQQAMFDRLARFYDHAAHPAMVAIERTACGCDYGGTSWTTRSEAARLAALLKLGPGRRFLDIGAGSGWPGLYLARLTGCDVTLADIPVSGLRLASDRAATDRLTGECWTVAADGAALPFDNGAFDAIGHSDVLCCLEAKPSVLRECRRVIRINGRMAFTVISIAPGLSAVEHERAASAGPPFVETGIAYPVMLKRTGWEIVEKIDVTPEYKTTVRTMFGAEQAHADDLGQLWGDAEFSERMTRRRKALEAIESGLLRRELFVTARVS
jgi:ubiquinone/menaquinone biosynthesis C-methylase UbiE